MPSFSRDCEPDQRSIGDSLYSCYLCQKEFDVKRSGHSCVKCERMTCSDCGTELQWEIRACRDHELERHNEIVKHRWNWHQKTVAELNQSKDYYRRREMKLTAELAEANAIIAKTKLGIALGATMPAPERQLTTGQQVKSLVNDSGYSRKDAAEIVKNGGYVA